MARFWFVCGYLLGEGDAPPPMPQSAKRTSKMPSSPIRRLMEYALAAEARGVHVHYLNIGQPDLASPDAFWNEVANSGLRVLEYSHSLGLPGLRKALANDYAKKGIDVHTSEIMVCNGASEATLLAFLSCFDPGDQVIVTEPFYANYLGFAVAAGIELVPITTFMEEDFALPSTEEIAHCISPKTRGILLCNPGNPTGSVYGTEELQKIARLVKQLDLFLIVDEVYRDFYYGKNNLTSILQVEGLEQNAVMIDSASKRFSLCGARVGFLVTRNMEVLAGALKFGQARLAAPTLDQMGVQAALENTPEEYFQATRAEYMGRRDVLMQGLSEIPGVVSPSIEGAFYALVRLPVDDADRFCQWILTNFQYEGESVLLAPASGFYLTPGLGRNEVRIAYVLEKEKLKRAVRIIAEALDEYSGSIIQGGKAKVTSPA